MPKYKKLTKQDKIDIEAGILKFKHAAACSKASAEKLDLSAGNCGLCSRYMPRYTCSGRCPVAKVTGLDECWGTPYYWEVEEVGYCLQDHRRTRKHVFERFKKQCLLMADFLQSLLDNDPGKEVKGE